MFQYASRSLLYGGYILPVTVSVLPSSVVPCRSAVRNVGWIKLYPFFSLLYILTYDYLLPSTYYYFYYLLLSSVRQSDRPRQTDKQTHRNKQRRTERHRQTQRALFCPVSPSFLFPFRFQRALLDSACQSGYDEIHVAFNRNRSRLQHFSDVFSCSLVR